MCRLHAAQVLLFRPFSAECPYVAPDRSLQCRRTIRALTHRDELLKKAAKLLGLPEIDPLVPF